MKIWILFGGWDYEGAQVCYVGSSKELTEQWRDKYFEYKNPYPEDKKWKYKRWVSKNNQKWFDSFDSMEIEEWSIDEDITNRV